MTHDFRTVVCELSSMFKSFKNSKEFESHNFFQNTVFCFYSIIFKQDITQSASAPTFVGNYVFVLLVIRCLFDFCPMSAGAKLGKLNGLSIICHKSRNLHEFIM